MDGETADRVVAGVCPVRRLGRLGAVAAVALLTANCGAPQKVASSKGRGGIDPKYGVAASPRVIPEGQPIPKGGGRQMVGKPYTVAGRTYVPSESKTSREGLASWYGEAFHGRLTANGEIFDRQSIAAAHATMPLPSYARVTNLTNRRSMIVRVNDRGPYHADRIIDVSENAADALGFRRAGTARVRVDYIGRASVNGSDDRQLLATLRDDGLPAGLPGRSAPTMLASAEERAPKPVLSHSAQILQASAAARSATPPGEPIRLASAAADVPLPKPAPLAFAAEDENEERRDGRRQPVRTEAPREREPSKPMRLTSAPAAPPVRETSRERAAAPLPPGRPIALNAKSAGGAAPIHSGRPLAPAAAVRTRVASPR